MRRYENARGALELMAVSETVLRVRVEGHLGEDFARSMVNFVDAELVASAAPLEVFLDWEQMTGYDALSRNLSIDLVVRRAAKLKAVHALVRSSLVAMGLATANLVTRTVGIELVSYRNRPTFEHALAGATTL